LELGDPRRFDHGSLLVMVFRVWSFREARNRQRGRAELASIASSAVRAVGFLRAKSEYIFSFWPVSTVPRSPLVPRNIVMTFPALARLPIAYAAAVLAARAHAASIVEGQVFDVNVRPVARAQVLFVRDAYSPVTDVDY